MVKKCIHIIWLTAFAGCVADDDLSVAPDAHPGSAIAFTADISQAADDSRGVVTDADNLDMFAVSASVTDADGPSVYFAHETYQFGMVGEQVQTSLSGQTHYWLDNDSRYDFFAYSPSEYLTFADGVIDKFDFVVADDVAEQADIVVCAALNATYGKSVALDFAHPLSKISLSQGSLMAGGTIESISFSGILNKGEYDMRKAQWSTYAADTTTFTYKCDTPSAPKSSITGSQYNFFFIPQSLGTNACMKVSFVDSVGVAHNYTKPLAGKWAAGGSYNYTLSISPQLSFIVADSIVDAYYSIVKVKVDAPSVMSQQQWAVKVEASDGADVSVQWQENANSFAKMGFWTDNYLVNGTPTQSARGSSTTETVNGAATDILYVFVPENTGTTDRKITISAVAANGVMGSTVITQKCPAWASDTGWSQLDDGSLSDFGFMWSRSLAYVLPYSVSEYGLETDFSKSDALAILNGMISLGGASAYTDIDTYYTYHIDNVGTIWHYYLHLNYSLCNALAAGSRTNGYTNTSYLNKHGGSAATESFQLMVARATQGSGQTLFRLPSSAFSQENTVPRPTGVDNLALSALCKTLKHNRFNYSVTQIDEAVLEYPSLAASDLVWYLPAVEQFRNLPSKIADPIVPGMCWSSTAVPGSTRAYLGSGVAVSRAEMAHVRCCRLSTTQ